MPTNREKVGIAVVTLGIIVTMFEALLLVSCGLLKLKG